MKLEQGLGIALAVLFIVGGFSLIFTPEKFCKSIGMMPWQLSWRKSGGKLTRYTDLAVGAGWVILGFAAIFLIATSPNQDL